METYLTGALQNNFIKYFLLIWELVWKSLALWKSAKSGQKLFFILLMVFNTLGLLPISYLIYRHFLEKKLALKKVE